MAMGSEARNVAASATAGPSNRRAGVPWAGFHTLRHTCATILFRRGLNAKQVQSWMGHHSPAFTLSVYVHLLADDLPDVSILDSGATHQPSRAPIFPQQSSTPSTSVVGGSATSTSGSSPSRGLRRMIADAVPPSR